MTRKLTPSPRKLSYLSAEANWMTEPLTSSRRISDLFGSEANTPRRALTIRRKAIIVCLYVGATHMQTQSLCSRACFAISLEQASVLPHLRPQASTLNLACELWSVIWPTCG